MSNSKQLRETRKIELVETHNISLSLDRLRDAPGWDQWRWKRAIYHALGMSGIDSGTLEKIRQALELP